MHPAVGVSPPPPLPVATRPCVHPGCCAAALTFILRHQIHTHAHLVLTPCVHADAFLVAPVYTAGRPSAQPSTTSRGRGPCSAQARQPRSASKRSASPCRLARIYISVRQRQKLASSSCVALRAGHLLASGAKLAARVQPTRLGHRTPGLRVPWRLSVSPSRARKIPASVDEKPLVLDSTRCLCVSVCLCVCVCVCLGGASQASHKRPLLIGLCFSVVAWLLRL